MSNKYKCAILYHCYYNTDNLKSIIKKVKRLNLYEPTLLIASVNNNLDPVFQEDETENAIYLKVSNKGKDIGGKFLSIDVLLNTYQDIEYVAFLHDKKSYYKQSGDFERIQLHSIVEEDAVKKILTLFRENPAIGLICNKNAIKNEFSLTDGNFRTTNSEIIKSELQRYNIEITDYSFAAGTMFWIKTSILKDFFFVNKILDIRSKFETGNVLDHNEGTFTHTWERLFSFITKSQGYKIVGLQC